MMMSLKERVVVVALAMVVIGSGINALNICNVPVGDLMTCKPAATAPNPPAPTAECCSAISHADLPCLCGYKNSPILPSIGIDPDLAVQLPAKCNIPNPPQC
ncbi:putative lipid-transfer protein DIR1, partial [Mucuna pruriens]